MLAGKLPEFNEEFLEKPTHQFDISGSQYQIDLNDDGIEELIIPQKRDGVDWLEIRDSSRNVIFESQIFSMGSESSIYKIKFSKISSSIKVLILYVDEGKTEGRRFESTGRLYFISFENNNLKSMSLSSGPHFFHEKSYFRETYFRRDYVINLIDYNQDGKKEISVEYNHIQRIYEYKGKGEWTRY